MQFVISISLRSVGCIWDVAFVVENSFLVGGDQNWQLVNQFLEALINRLNVNTDPRIPDDPFTRIAEVIQTSLDFKS